MASDPPTASNGPRPTDPTTPLCRRRRDDLPPVFKIESWALVLVAAWLILMTVGGFVFDADRRAGDANAKAQLEDALERVIAEQRERGDERRKEHVDIHVDINKTRELLRTSLDEVRRALAEKKAACRARLECLDAAAQRRAEVIETESSATEAYRRALGSCPAWDRETLVALEDGMPAAAPGFRALDPAPKAAAGGKAVAAWYAGRSAYLKSVLAER